MATIITHEADTITPTQVLGYSAEREAGNVVHPILGRSNPDVTLRPASLRTGTLSLGFQGDTSEEDSAECAEIHAVGGVFSIFSTERATVEMSYVSNGRITRELDDESRDAWVVTVDFQEIAE